MNRFRKLIMIANALFLSLTGFAQMIFELLSHYRGMGPLNGIFTDTPYTIGFFEAHGFAVLTGILVFSVMLKGLDAHWHLYLAGVCLLLGGSNLLFWDSFSKVGLVAAGIVATSLHVTFFVLQVVCYLISRREEKRFTSSHA